MQELEGEDVSIRLTHERERVQLTACTKGERTPKERSLGSIRSAEETREEQC